MADSDDSEFVVEVRRSTRRRRTVSAYREAGKVVVMIPQRFTRAQEREYVAKMLRQLGESEARQQRRSKTRASDDGLAQRAAELSRLYFGAQLSPASIRWVPAMRTRWASCTPVDASIRISTRLQTMPSWVLDYVIVHELAHLQVAGHGEQFWSLVNRYPKTERARGYLDGVSAAAGLGISDSDES